MVCGAIQSRDRFCGARPDTRRLDDRRPWTRRTRTLSRNRQRRRTLPLPRGCPRGTRDEDGQYRQEWQTGVPSDLSRSRTSHISQGPPFNSGGTARPLLLSFTSLPRAAHNRHDGRAPSRQVSESRRHRRGSLRLLLAGGVGVSGSGSSRLEHARGRLAPMR